MEIERDYSPIVTGALSDAEFLDNNKLWIKYFEGKDYTEKQETIDLN